MKIQGWNFLILFALFFGVILAAGCQGIVKPNLTSTSAEMNSTDSTLVKLTAQIRTADDNVTQNLNISACPLPILVFNNSQKKTIISRDGLIISKPDDKPSTASNVVPFQGIIYHDQGHTRIFDSTGRQILSINDADSGMYVPGGGGFSPATNIYVIPSNTISENDGDNIVRIYTEDTPTKCLATIIKSAGSNIKVIIS